MNFGSQDIKHETVLIRLSVNDPGRQEDSCNSLLGDANPQSASRANSFLTLLLKQVRSESSNARTHTLNANFSRVVAGAASHFADYEPPY